MLSMFFHPLYYLLLYSSTKVPLPPGSSRGTKTSPAATLQWISAGLWGGRHAGVDPREKGREHWGRTGWCLGAAEEVWWISEGKQGDCLDVYFGCVCFIFVKWWWGVTGLMWTQNMKHQLRLEETWPVFTARKLLFTSWEPAHQFFLHSY